MWAALILLISPVTAQADENWQETFAQQKFLLSVYGNYMISSDTNFKDIYGSGNLLPEVKAGFKVTGNLYFWAGYGFLSVAGTIPEIEEDAEAKQQFLSLGIGYTGRLNRLLGYTADIGLAGISYKENALGEEASGNTLGFRLDGGLQIFITEGICAEISAGYIYGSDTVNEIDIKLGGFKGSIGLGFRF